MHSAFKFPIECQSQTMKIDNPRIKEIEGEFYISGQITNETYNAFNFVDIIPELVSLVEKVEYEGKDKTNGIKKWVKKWGLLKGKEIQNNIYGQSINDFWEQAFQFMITWRAYRAIVNKEEDLLEYALQNLESWFELGESKLEKIQWNAMRLVNHDIERHIKNGEMLSHQIALKKNYEEDRFEVKPIFYFQNLIDALYMQFFTLINENEKKICPVCNKAFLPERKDKKYCSNSCKLTAKSRRYRARKEKNI